MDVIKWLSIWWNTWSALIQQNVICWQMWQSIFPKIVPNLPEQTEKHLCTIFYKKIWKLFGENVNYLFKCLNNILEFTMNINPSADHNIYRDTHKGWDFRDDCTEFIFLSIYSWFPATINLYLSLPDQ